MQRTTKWLPFHSVILSTEELAWIIITDGFAHTVYCENAATPSILEGYCSRKALLGKSDNLPEIAVR